jgi:DNA-binding transcriptional regulator YdaS (Cro superfamily)
VTDNTTRPTVELEPVDNLATHRYSVRRAATDDERAQLVERVAVGRVTPQPLKPQWRVDHNEKTVTLRNQTMQIELSADDARRIAEAILRGR